MCPHRVHAETDIKQVNTQMSLQALISAQKKCKVGSEDNIGLLDLRVRQLPESAALMCPDYQGQNCSRSCQGTASLKALGWEWGVGSWN